ncbi:MAG: Holliday junction branch migration protein RuvA [Marvinbryantia sp.]
MIAFIKGTMIRAEENSVIIENNGIGYRVFACGRDISRIVNGSEVLLHTYMNVREDAMQLFGFLSAEDLEVFRLLLGVNGIGPKAALGVLSGMTANDLRFAVLSDDIKTLSTAPGIGKKTAQKLILELKDKFSLQDAFEEKLALTEAAGTAADSNQEEAIQALMALGYSGSDALKAVRAAAADNMSTEDILKAALKRMSF